MDEERLKWLREQLKRADYCRVGQWGEAGEEIEEDVLDLIEENDKFREALWNLNPTPGHYGDDGEMQVAGLDYKRQRAEDIIAATVKSIQEEVESLRNYEKVLEAQVEFVMTDVERLTKRCEGARPYVEFYRNGNFPDSDDAKKWLAGS